MDRKSKTRSHLMAVYGRLTPLEKALMQLCSIIYEPVEVGTVIRCFRQTGLSFPGKWCEEHDRTRVLSRSPAEPQALNKNFQCPEGIVELCSREAVNTPHHRLHRRPQVRAGQDRSQECRSNCQCLCRQPFSAHGPSGTAGGGPVYWFGRGGGSNYCHRLMRNLRIADYTQDLELLRRSHDHCAGCARSFMPTRSPGPGRQQPFRGSVVQDPLPDLQRTNLPLILFSTLFSLKAMQKRWLMLSLPRSDTSYPVAQRPRFVSSRGNPPHAWRSPGRGCKAAYGSQ